MKYLELSDKVKHKKIINNIFFINLIPVILVHLIYLALWLLSNKTDFGTLVALTELIIDLFLVPAYLISVNYQYALKNNKKSYLLNTFLMLVAVVIGNALSYLNWGISSGELFNPDYLTVAISKGVLILNIIVVLLSGITSHIKFRYLKHFN